MTFHAAEGRTVDSGIAVFTGEEDRQATYVALTRGRENNEAFVIAGWRIADPKPGPEPAPELARQERLDREHAGLDAAGRRQEHGTNQEMTAEQILAQCLDRDGQQLSATDTREPRNGPTPTGSTCSACNGSTSPATPPSTGTKPLSAPP